MAEPAPASEGTQCHPDGAGDPAEIWSTSAVPPGSLGVPPLGEIAQYRRDPVGFLWRRYQRYGRVFKTHLGSPTVFMIGPEANRFILRDHSDLFSVGTAWPPFVRFMLGDEAMSLHDGDAYQRLRLTMAPAFSAPTMKQSFSSMKECAHEHLERWSEAGPICFVPAVHALIADVMSRWVLGPPRSPSEGRWLTACIEAFTSVPESRRDVLERPGGPERGARRIELHRKLLAREQLREHLTGVVAARRRNPTDDAVSLLCKAHESRRPLTDHEVIAQILTLLSAGTDSTSSTATWLVQALALHGDVRKRLRSEVDDIVGGSELEWSHLKHLPYLKCVLKEVQRLYPAALAPARVALDDFSFDGYCVPRDTVVRYCIVLTHQLPEVFTDPRRFDPDRFLPPRDEEKRTPFSLIGFGGGPRHCTGKPFAEVLLEVLAATMLLDYHWVVPADQDLSPVLDNNTTFKPRSRLRVQFSRGTAEAATERGQDSLA